jgi:hypothetical protein
MMSNTFSGVLHNWWYNPHDHTISGDVYDSLTKEDGTWVTTASVISITTRKVCDYIQDVSMGDPCGYLVRGSTSKAYKVNARDGVYELGIPVVLALPKEQ